MKDFLHPLKLSVGGDEENLQFPSPSQEETQFVKWITVVLPYPRLACCGFSYPQSTSVRKQMILLLTKCRKINSSLTYFSIPRSLTPLHLTTQAFHHLASSQERGEYSTVRYSERQHPRNFYYSTFL